MRVPYYVGELRRGPNLENYPPQQVPILVFGGYLIMVIV